MYERLGGDLVRVADPAEMQQRVRLRGDLAVAQAQDERRARREVARRQPHRDVDQIGGGHGRNAGAARRPSSVVSRGRLSRRTSAAVNTATSSSAASVSSAESTLNQAEAEAAPGVPATVATERVLKYSASITPSCSAIIVIAPSNTSASSKPMPARTSRRKAPSTRRIPVRARPPARSLPVAATH